MTTGVMPPTYIETPCRQCGGGGEMPELIERELRTAQVTVRQISENASQRGKLLLNNRAETKATPERAGNAIEGLTIGPSPALTQEVPNG